MNAENLSSSVRVFVFGEQDRLLQIIKNQKHSVFVV